MQGWPTELPLDLPAPTARGHCPAPRKDPRSTQREGVVGVCPVSVPLSTCVTVTSPQRVGGSTGTALTRGLKASFLGSPGHGAAMVLPPASHPRHSSCWAPERAGRRAHCLQLHSDGGSCRAAGRRQAERCLKCRWASQPPGFLRVLPQELRFSPIQQAATVSLGWVALWRATLEDRSLFA